MLSDELRYKILKILQDQPQISQRDLARELGISLGRVNYCIKALIEKGFVVAAEFRQTRNKKRFYYMLTPKGLEDRARVTVRFLRRKVEQNSQTPISKL
jgi:EPS-associated MarR family transcriptional regulator